MKRWPCRITASPDLAERLNSAAESIAMARPGSLGAMIQAAVLQIAKGSPMLESGLVTHLAAARFRIVVEARAPKEFGIALAGNVAEPEMAALAVDLVAASQAAAFQLRRCFNDGLWFSPGLRSSRSKFCSTQCRMKFNYEMRVPRAAFVCSGCELAKDIDAFSGLSLMPAGVEPTDAHSPSPLCVRCVVAKHSEWSQYLMSTDLSAVDGSISKQSKPDYAIEMSRLIRESLEKSGEPQHYQQIAVYVKQRIAVQGDSPDLTVLGYILRKPSLFKQKSKHVFALAGVRSRRVRGLASEKRN